MNRAGKSDLSGGNWPTMNRAEPPCAIAQATPATGPCYFMIVPEDACSTMNAEWRTASVNYALQNVAIMTDVDAVIGATRD